MILFKELRKTFNSGKPNEFTALHGISGTIETGKMTILKGPSGSGKTTLLGLIGCMARPTSGRIFLRDREITSLPERFLTQVRRETFGFIFQQFNLVKGLTVLENVMLPTYPTGRKRSEVIKDAKGLLALLGLERKESALVEWLSGGEAQRVAIARALINKPAVIIADEPTAHLDSRLAQDFMEVMNRLREQGKTVIIASHDPIAYASDFADRVIDMKDGLIVGEETKA